MYFYFLVHLQSFIQIRVKISVEVGVSVRTSLLLSTLHWSEASHRKFNWSVEMLDQTTVGQMVAWICLRSGKMYAIFSAVFFVVVEKVNLWFFFCVFYQKLWLVNCLRKTKPLLFFFCWMDTAGCRLLVSLDCVFSLTGNYFLIFSYFY